MEHNAGRSRTRVLVVGQGVGGAIRLADWLAADGCEPVAVATAEEGLAVLPEVNPDALLLDSRLPLGTALDTLRAVRRRYPHLPMMTMVDAEREDAALSLEDAPSTCIVKPLRGRPLGPWLASEVRGLCAPGGAQ
ncbi:response regulator [Candidatus Nitrospira bockiana]